MSNEAKAAVPWPGEGNYEGPWGAEAVLRWLASEGVERSAVGVDLLPDDWDDAAAKARYFINVYRTFYCHDLYLTLSALSDVDPAKADEMADRIIASAHAGDSYGEWLWEWATGHGLDAQQISDEARARLAEAAS